MNLKSVLEISAKVTGLQDITKLEGAIAGTEKAARSAAQGFKAMLDSRAFQVAAVGAAAMGTAIALSTKAAIDFESSMADVRKVVSGLESPKAFREISKEIMDLSSRMPIAAKGFAEIYAAAGQAGIAREDLKQFATQVAQVAVAFDMTAEEAGTSMAKIQTSLGLTLPQLSDLTDAMNYLSNNTASSAADLVDFTLRAGQAGKSAGLSAEQTAAFGAAMVSSGFSSEVAATSFNNMIKALSRGPSMTDRQIGALTKLGYAQSDAVANEQRYTSEVKQQSERRIEAARQETDELSKEINRRYRDQLRTIQDGYDDQNEQNQRQVDRFIEAEVKKLQRLQDAEIDAARARAGENEEASKSEIDAIRDRYDQQMDALRERGQQMIKEDRRINRDRLQLIQDDMDDRKDAELAGVQKSFNELQQAEKTAMETRLAQIKEQAKAGATSAAEALAKGLQENAIGTITDVFNRIRELPKEAQLSVISDLFGDEARAILPLVNNTELFEKAMGLVGDKTKYTGSTLQEFLTRSATTANQLQLAQNNLENLSITFGQSFAPALSAAVQALSPLLQGFTWLLQNVPGLGPALAVLTGAFVALVAVLPAIASAVFLIGQLGGLSAIFATIAGTLGAVVPLLAGFGATIAGWAGAVIPTLTAILAFIGPVGLIALGVIALGVLIYKFRDQIGAVFSGLGALVAGAFLAINESFIQPFLQAFGGIIEWFTNTFSSILELLTFPFRLAIAYIQQEFIPPILEFIGGLIEQFVQMWSGFFEIIKGPFVAAWQFLQENFITPIGQAISSTVEFIGQNWEKLKDMLLAPFVFVGNAIKSILNTYISGVEMMINGVVRAINGLISRANAIGAAVGLAPIQMIAEVRIPRFAEGGIVNGPTVALVGEAGPEYIVPAHKAEAFAQNYLAGIRGPAAIPRFAEGGYVAPSSANVNIQTGPVTQMNGTNFVTTQDMSAAVRAGVQQTLDLIRRDGNVRTQLGLA